jgi:hypothetical protein
VGAVIHAKTLLLEDAVKIKGFSKILFGRDYRALPNVWGEA